MKKILNRIAAAAIAVPIALTQGVVMNISAEDAGVKALTLDTFTAIPADQTESEWNTKVLNMAASMEGTQTEISKDDFAALLPENNSYAVMIKEIMAEADNPILTVNNGVVTIKATADMTDYAEAKIYSKVREALANEGYTDEVTMDAFNKTVEFTATVDASVLASGKDVNVDFTLTADGEDIKTNLSGYFKNLASELASSVAEQVGVLSSDVEDALNVEMIQKLERAEDIMAKAAATNKSGSYATADELLNAVSDYAAKHTEVYSVPASVDEFVSRHGNGFNKAIELLSGITASSGYTLDVTADDVAELAKSGSNFEASASAGTYELTFQIPDAEADEVETYVNANAEEGKAYDYSYKLVEVKASMTGAAYFNVTRVIVLKDVEDTGSSTTTTTVTDESGTTESSDTTTTVTGEGGSTESSDTTTTVTGEGGTTESSDTTTTTVTGEGGSTESSDTTTTVTGEGGSTESSDTTTTTSEEFPEGFILESVEVTAGKGFYFSHDENEFDLTELVESLTLVGTLEDEDYTVVISPSSYEKYLVPAHATPAEYFNSVEGTAYVADTLGLTFNVPSGMTTADDADLTITDEPIVYIGVKGDADLDGTVGLNDATLTLTYYAYGVGLQPELKVFNEDADLNTLAYFLADVDTESKAGADSDDGKIDLADATYILTYYAYIVGLDEHSWTAVLAG